MTNKQKIQELRRRDPLVAGAFNLIEVHTDADYTKLLELLVVTMADRHEVLEKQVVESVHKAIAEALVVMGVKPPVSKDGTGNV